MRQRFAFGPVHVVVLPHPAGTAAVDLVRAELAGALDRPAEALRFVLEAHGRPRLELPGLDCNWSHSGDRLAIAWGAGVRVGIDIERPRPRPRAVELARRYFTTAEADALAALPAGDRETGFLRLWCAKEAVLKAHGRGLAFGLDRLRFDGIGPAPRLVEADAELGAVDGWTLEPLAIEGLVGTVAWRAA
ncbi:4'-phosphopantetheinyl transferase family protein [Lysobacter xanthus]